MNNSSKEKMKICGQCKAEISKSARKCMHCGSKQGIGVLGGILIFGVLGAVIIPIIADNRNIEPPPPPSAAELAQKTPAKAKTDAMTNCMEWVQAQAKFPSSVDFSIFSSPGTSPRQGGGWVVELAFESKNGLGNLIPQMARCDVIAGTIVYFDVTNR